MAAWFNYRAQESVARLSAAAAEAARLAVSVAEAARRVSAELSSHHAADTQSLPASQRSAGTAE